MAERRRIRVTNLDRNVRLRQRIVGTKRSENVIYLLFDRY